MVAAGFALGRPTGQASGVTAEETVGGSWRGCLGVLGERQLLHQSSNGGRVWSFYILQNDVVLMLEALNNGVLIL